MTNDAFTKDDLFDGGPPMRLQRALSLVKPGQRRVGKRALLVVLIGWAPLAVLSAVQAFAWSSQTVGSFFSDYAVHARYLIAAPLLILAEADCLPRLGRIALHFLDAGLVADEDLARYERAVSSTRRLLDSTIGEVLAVIAAYAVAILLLFYVMPEQFPEWYRSESGKFLGLSAAGWWHALVSLPLLLMLFVGWLWRLILWGRFLFLMARLNLRLIPSHPDHAAGLKFVSLSLNRFRLLSLAMGSMVAGTIANRVAHHGQHLLEFKNFAIGLTVIVLIFFAGPLFVFLRRLRQTRMRGVLEYGAFAVSLGAQFENKWLVGTKKVGPASLEVPDFSATTDLYGVAANVYEMRELPFNLKDLIRPVAAGLAPFLPVALLDAPLQVIVDSVIKLLL